MRHRVKSSRPAPGCANRPDSRTTPSTPARATPSTEHAVSRSFTAPVRTLPPPTPVGGSACTPRTTAASVATASRTTSTAPASSPSAPPAPAAPAAPAAVRRASPDPAATTEPAPAEPARAGARTRGVGSGNAASRTRGEPTGARPRRRWAGARVAGAFAPARCAMPRSAAGSAATSPPPLTWPDVHVELAYHTLDPTPDNASRGPNRCGRTTRSG